MIKKLTNLASGWKPGTAADYKKCFDLYGGNFITHPEVLAFLHSRLDCRPHYSIKRNSNGTLLGAFCSWRNSNFACDGKTAKAIKLGHYQFNKDEITLPFHPKLRIALPFKTKILSSLNRRNVLNSSFKLNFHRAVCLAKGCGKDGFSSSTKNSRKRELNKFIKAGGEIFDQSHFPPQELITIYFDLFEKRWGHRPSHFLETVDMFTSLRQFLFGHILFLAGEPCAFQLITKAESPKWINFDYVNGGYDQRHDSFCPGTIVTWLNVKSAYELCEAVGKTMRYSFGKPTAGYKDRWCYQDPLGRVLSL